MQRGIGSLLLIVVLSAAVVLAVTNRHSVPVHLDPFAPSAAFDAPLYLVVAVALACGIVLGGLARGRTRR